MSSEYTAEEKEEMKEDHRKAKIRDEEMRKRKVCPLFVISDSIRPGKRMDRHAIRCGEAACAWWEDSFNGCSIKVLAGAAAFLAGVGMDDEEE